jgi:tight adherence protein B
VARVADWRRRRAAARARTQLPEVLDAVASELRGGATLAGALQAFAAGPHPLAVEFTEVAAGLGAGRPMRVVLQEWSQTTDVVDAGVVAAGLVVATESGGRAAGALEQLAVGLRDELGVRAECRALSTQARASAFVLVGAPFGFLLFTTTLDPGRTAALVALPLARAAIVAGLLLDALGAWSMRRIVQAAA